MCVCVFFFFFFAQKSLPLLGKERTNRRQQRPIKRLEPGSETWPLTEKTNTPEMQIKPFPGGDVGLLFQEKLFREGGRDW